MDFTIRQANDGDIEQMQNVRMSVRENKLVSIVISADDYKSQINETGRGWVAEIDGRVIGFAIGNIEKGYIWALFVDPEFEGRGIGRKLHERMLDYMWRQGCERIRLTTAANTRAEGFYQKAGWTKIGVDKTGEVIFEKTKI